MGSDDAGRRRECCRDDAKMVGAQGLEPWTRWLREVARRVTNTNEAVRRSAGKLSILLRESLMAHYVMHLG